MTLPLHTERLIVREFTAADLDALATVFADPAVLWWEPAPYTRQQTRSRSCPTTSAREAWPGGSA